MAENTIKKSGITKEYDDDSGGGVLIPHPVIGIVKDNIDPEHGGRIKVYIARLGGPDPEDSKQWTTVKYLSPYAGIAVKGYDIYNGGPKTGQGDFLSNPHSYGFWATAPDLGTRVVCIFINGDPQDGYYIGAAPWIGLTHMMPAVAASSKVVPNQKEAELYGGADRLPVIEVNYSNPTIRQSERIYDQPKLIHSYQSNILAKQGLIRDNLRGVIGSSSQRETPSRVFGISTPGPTIYEGGAVDATIKTAAETSDKSKLQVVGRRGGHSLVMDDGTINGEDQLLRIRTSAGHMIMLNDSGQVLTIIHSNGQSWIELGKEGTIDMFSTNSVNIRTEGDLNLHADRDINIHAKRNLRTFADNTKMESTQNHVIRTGKDFSGYSMGRYLVKADQQMSFLSSGDASFRSSNITYINGAKIHLNTGASATIPGVVPEVPKVNHVETTFSQNKGWMNPSPTPVQSITTRTPTHMPWAEANKGVAL